MCFLPLSLYGFVEDTIVTIFVQEFVKCGSVLIFDKTRRKKIVLLRNIISTQLSCNLKYIIYDFNANDRYRKNFFKKLILSSVNVPFNNIEGAALI